VRGVSGTSEVSKLPTQNDTSETVAWQSNSVSELTRSEKDFISGHWSEVTHCRVPPEIAWKWGECGILHLLKQRWAFGGIVTRAPDGDRWLTTETLSWHVIERPANDVPVGVDVLGQRLLLVHSGRWGKFQSIVEDTIETGGADS